MTDQNGWKTNRLGDVCLKIGSGATPRGGKDVYLETGPYALVRSQNVYNDGFHRDGLAFIGERHASELNNVEVMAGDVLLNITGDSVARVCQVDDAILPARVNQHVAIIRADPNKLDSRFLRYALVTAEMQSQLLSWVGAGATRNALTKAMIESLDVLAPPDVNEQRAIAHILGTLDDKIELNRRMNETLEAIARALFKSWFVDFDPVRAKAEGRDTGLPPHVAELFPAGFEESELGKIPAGWKVEPLGDHVDVMKGVSYKGSGLSGSGVPLHNLNSIYEGGGYKYDGIKYYQGDFADRHVVHPGDLIVANTEQGHHHLLIGFAAIVPSVFGARGAISHHIYRLDPSSSSQLPRSFIYHLINSRRMHQVISGYSNGTSINMLPATGLQKPRFVVPPGELINAFRGLADNVVKKCEESVAENQTLAALRDTLLPKLISGEIRLKDAEKFVEAAT